MLVGDRRLAGADDAARLAAANVEDQPGQHRQPVVEEGWVDPALEAGAGVAGQLQGLAGAGDPLGVEESDFEQSVGGGVADPAMFAAHDAADVVDLGRVGDHRHPWVEAIFLLVQGHDRLAVAGAAGGDGAVQFGEVIGVARPAEVEHDIIGDVDQRRDRPLAGALQALLQPVGRGAVL